MTHQTTCVLLPAGPQNALDEPKKHILKLGPRRDGISFYELGTKWDRMLNGSFSSKVDGSRRVRKVCREKKERNRTLKLPFRMYVCM